MREMGSPRRGLTACVLLFIGHTATAGQHHKHEGLKVAEYVREVREHSDADKADGGAASAAGQHGTLDGGQAAGYVSPGALGWESETERLVAVQAIADAADARRIAIRAHYGLEATEEAAGWLDGAIGFTNDAAREVLLAKTTAAVRQRRPFPPPPLMLRPFLRHSRVLHTPSISPLSSLLLSPPLLPPLHNPLFSKVLLAKMTAAVNQRRPFRVGVMGISVTAGHDCHHNESFPYVFARHFGDALRAGGVPLEVKNHAIGGFGVMPSHLCTGAMIGEHNDVAVWDYQVGLVGMTWHIRILPLNH